MERLGTADRVAQGLIIARTTDVSDVGAAVIDEDLEDVGSVVDVFGPVERPYTAISPVDGRSPASAVGIPLYVR